MNGDEHMRIMKLAVPTAALAILAEFASVAPAADAASSNVHPTVAYNFWRGSHWQPHAYGSVRPRVWGNFTFQPETNLRWTYWHARSATGHGLLTITGCQPCHMTLHFYDLQTVHGTRYFKKLKWSERESGASGYEHWNGHSWV